MADALTTNYAKLLRGSYDCLDRIVLNAYFRLAHSPGGFRIWWRRLHGGEDTLDNAHLIRMSGRFRRRLRAWAAENRVPVRVCNRGEQKHDVAEEYRQRAEIQEGLFLIIEGRAQAPVWDVQNGGLIRRKKPHLYVNHFSFHILDRDWGHITIKISGHPPFPAQIILNGHEYVERQAVKAGLTFTKERNCFVELSDASAFTAIAETLTSEEASGLLTAVCERWIYRTCLRFALDDQERKESKFRYQYSTYQLEHSRKDVLQRWPGRGW